MFRHLYMWVTRCGHVPFFYAGLAGTLHCLLWKFHKRAKAMKLDEQVSKSSHYINIRNSFVASHWSTQIAAVLEHGLMSGSRGLHALSSQSLCHLTFSTAVPFPRCFTANSWETPRQLLVFLMAIKKYLRHKMHFHRPPSRVPTRMKERIHPFASG